MFHLRKPIIVCTAAGTLGLSLFPFALHLEESLGLPLLFKLRGTRPAPSEVCVVAVDKASAANLGLSDKTEEWPRSLHARLTETLTKAGASVIVFDLLFERPSLADDDPLFSDAIQQGKNIVLCTGIRKEAVPLFDKQGKHHGELDIERIVLPVAPLAESGAALAPFPLPKVPVRVTQYWTIKTSAGDLPTLPIVAFQLFALPLYDNFISLLAKASPSEARKLPLHGKEQLRAPPGVVELIGTVKAIFKKNPQIAGKMLAELDNPNSLSRDNKQRQILRSLINLYQGSDSRYLNFYGPPGTIKSIPYYQVLQTQSTSPLPQKPPDVAGKAVFIGHSEQILPAEQDAYNTIFSQANGVDLSGVEIAATAFANLLEDMPVRPVGLPVSCIIVFVWGAVLAVLCLFFSTTIAITSIIGLSILYLSFASHQFNHGGIWYPLVIPLFFQAPLTVYYTVLEKYVETNKERKKIRSALGYYLPARVADEMAKNLPDMRTAGHLVYGTCLSTDAEGYTTLSEMMPPGELKVFLNGYYEKIFFPVKQHGGIISDVVGDSMLAVWASAQPDATIKQKACLAAMDIANAIQQFNQSSGILKLPTRIGLHSGAMVLGNVGAMDHYEYRPVGDIVNTVSRIERLNKPLNTWVLISQAVREGLDGFLIREVGTFLLTGKSKPMVIYELLGCLENTSQEQKDLCAVFSEGLTAYKQQFWEEATKKFCTCMNVCKDDGLSKFYAALCDTYKKNPPEEGWNGVVCLDKK